MSVCFHNQALHRHELYVCHERSLLAGSECAYAGAAVGGVVMLSGIPVGCLPLCRRVVGAAVVQKCVVFLTASILTALTVGELVGSEAVET